MPDRSRPEGVPDPFAIFDDLAYPGRRKPVNRGTIKPMPQAPKGWDDTPVYYKVNGVQKEFFLIADLAAALGYSVQSIRAWENVGLLPSSPFRSPQTRRPVAAGSTKGKRLWTREQIEGILALAKKHRVILNREPPTPAFSAEVRLLFMTISAKVTASNP